VNGSGVEPVSDTSRELTLLAERAMQTVRIRSDLNSNYAGLVAAVIETKKRQRSARVDYYLAIAGQKIGWFAAEEIEHLAAPRTVLYVQWEDEADPDLIERASTKWALQIGGQRGVANVTLAEPLLDGADR
jgi:hypothetical protein